MNGPLRTAGAAALLLAGCAAPVEPAPEPPATTARGLPLALNLADEPARTLLEKVAARCWLDHVVGGGSLVVDRQTGRVVISSDTADMLIAEIAPAGDGSSIVRVTGPAARDPATALRLSGTLELAATTGQTSCAPTA